MEHWREPEGWDPGKVHVRASGHAISLRQLADSGANGVVISILMK
jgi:hypothetical protein